MSISKQGWLFKKLFRFLIANPVKALRMIDRRNIKILLKAIRSESPKQIFNNFLKRIDHRNEIQKTTQSEGTILRCSLSRVYDYKIHLEGWCLGDYEIKEVKVFLKDQLIGKVNFGLESVDVAKAFPNNKFSKSAKFSGIFWGDFDPTHPITLIAKDVNGLETSLFIERFTNTEQQDYNQYIKLNGLTTREKLEIEKTIKKPSSIGFSVVTSFQGDSIKYFTEIHASLKAQYFSNWEWLIYLSPSQKKNFELSDIELDHRVQLFSAGEMNAPSAINYLVTKRQFNNLVHLDGNTLLHSAALYELFKAIQFKKSSGVIYTDEDLMDEQMKRRKPNFKSDLNKDLLLSLNYIGSFIAIYNLEKNSFKLFDEQFNEGYLYHFMLMQMDQKDFLHLPKVLAHKRATNFPDSLKKEHKKAISFYLKSNNIVADVIDGIVPNSFDVKRKIAEEAKVSIIIPFKDEVELLKSCLASIFEKTNYTDFEIILVSNKSVAPTTFQYLDKIKNKEGIQCFEYNVPFNYSKINNWAVQKAKGDYLLFLNNDIEVISKSWLTTMVTHIQRDEVGAVGAKLLYPDNSVQHAGVIVGIGGVADHIFNSFPDLHDGYFGRANVVQNLSACTAACLMVKKSDFNLVNGFDEDNLAVEFNDVDLCLKLRAMDKTIVYNPHAKLYHYESKSRGKNQTAESLKRSEEEKMFFISKWGDFIKQGDPYYNKNLNLLYADYSIKLKPA